MFRSPFEPCIPSRGTKVPDRPEWIQEVKHDGYRRIVQRNGGRVRLFTRNGHDWSGRFPLISEAALRSRNSSFVIDDEAVLLGVDGRSDVNGLHSRRHDAEVEFYVQMLARDAKQPCNLALAPAQGRNHILAQDGAGVGRAAIGFLLCGIFIHLSSSPGRDLLQQSSWQPDVAARELADWFLARLQASTGSRPVRSGWLQIRFAIQHAARKLSHGREKTSAVPGRQRFDDNSMFRTLAPFCSLNPAKRLPTS